jgi:3-hydroxyacyl-CoA dehydrogenase/enoyl-CoA hydratase/3-hydroxybutyryl-CoA epimerase
MTAEAPALRNWILEVDGRGIAWLALDKLDSGTNVLSHEVMTELAAVLRWLSGLSARGLVIHSAKPGGFIAGADIKEFPAISSAGDAERLSQRGQEIFAQLESLDCPSVAVINGSALGGGLELAMSATWRIALPVEQPCLGLPEVQLGLHPGFGGTVRAVRLLGVRRGLELMLTGRPMTVTDGIRFGLIDAQTTPDAWRRDAMAFLERPRPRRRRSPGDSLLSLPVARGLVARSLRARVRARANPAHYPAPYAMIELWRAHGARGPEAYAAESRSFGRLADTPTSRNLVRVFFLRDRLKKLAGHSEAIRRVHVVGAGIMGGDIAAWCALQGLEVTLQDRETRFVADALARAEKLFAKQARTPAACDAARARLGADTSGAGVAEADLVIEAIFEDLAVKQELFRSIEARVRPGCVLATNTSSIPLEQIAGALRAPQRLIGLHFFNPVAKLPLVEVVHAEATDPAASALGRAFVRQIDKLPLPCRSRPGFLVNRILAAYMAEAMTLVQEGVPLPDIDHAATEFGMPMGPVELADSVGLDIALQVARTLAPVLKRPPASELERLVAAGRLGRKAGCGFYSYQEGRPVKPRERRRHVHEAVQERLVYALLNEAASCYSERIVEDADLLDAGVIFGTGFAPFRGGPLHYARHLGIDSVIARLEALSSSLGSRFEPSPGWNELRVM